jgi:hypothetical protein
VYLRARPLYRLSYKHIIYDNYIRRHGNITNIWTFDIYYYFLYRLETSGVTVKDKPPITTPRLLSIDGGGVRAIIALIVLQALEELVKLLYSVYRNFDFIFNTSIS